MLNFQRGLIFIGSAEQRKLNEANIKKTQKIPSENFRIFGILLYIYPSNIIFDPPFCSVTLVFEIVMVLTQM